MRLKLLEEKYAFRCIVYLDDKVDMTADYKKWIRERTNNHNYLLTENKAYFRNETDAVLFMLRWA